jgi:hypothetical protein
MFSGKLQWAKCYEEAGRICGRRGYSTLQQSSERHAAVGPNGGGTYNDNMMIIQCNGTA